jgi:hypothetical protein
MPRDPKTVVKAGTKPQSAASRRTKKNSAYPSKTKRRAEDQDLDTSIDRTLAKKRPRKVLKRTAPPQMMRIGMRPRSKLKTRWKSSRIPAWRLSFPKIQSACT